MFKRFSSYISKQKINLYCRNSIKHFSMLLINTSLKVICYLSLLLVCTLFTVSVYSYLSVYLTFGSVPFSQDYIPELIGDSGKSMNIFPGKIGFKIILAYMYSIVFLIGFVPMVFILKFYFTKIDIEKKLFVTLIIVNIVFYFLWGFTSIVGWYTNFVLD